MAPLEIHLKGIQSIAATAEVEILSAEPDATNSLAEPTKVVPVKSQVSKIKPSFTYTLSPYSITVIKLQTK